jgi:hypothetical protein
MFSAGSFPREFPAVDILTEIWYNKNKKDYKMGEDINSYTNEELDRQDLVDNAVQNILEELGGCEGSKMGWDMEHIGEVRDAIQNVIVHCLGIMPEKEFYPYREHETDSIDFTPAEREMLEKAFPKKKEPIYVDDGYLMEVIRHVFDCLDADDIASEAGRLLGGTCTHIGRPGGEGEDQYVFVPNVLYNGALDGVK